MREELERLQGLIEGQNAAPKLVAPTNKGFTPVQNDQITGTAVLGMQSGQQSNPKDFNTQVQQYHQWLDSIKVLRDNGEVSELELQERVDLMER